MIRRSEIVPMVRQVDQRFKPIVDEFMEEWSGNPDKDGLPEYLLFAEIGRVIANDIRCGNTAPLSRIFELIEAFHVQGDEYVREAATVGLLEDIQTNMLHDNTGLHLAHPFLGPESKLWWDKLILFWEGKKIDALRYD